MHRFFSFDLSVVSEFKAKCLICVKLTYHKFSPLIVPKASKVVGYTEPFGHSHFYLGLTSSRLGETSKQLKVQFFTILRWLELTQTEKVSTSLSDNLT